MGLLSYAYRYSRSYSRSLSAAERSFTRRLYTTGYNSLNENFVMPRRRFNSAMAFPLAMSRSFPYTYSRQAQPDFSTSGSARSGFYSMPDIVSQPRIGHLAFRSPVAVRRSDLQRHVLNLVSRQVAPSVFAKLNTCVKRRQRREVLLASGHGGGHHARPRKPRSSVRC